MNDDFSAAALIKFLSWAKDKGLMKTSTVSGMQIACRKMLQIEPNWQCLDVRQLDLEMIGIRFQNKYGCEFKPTSLGDYQSRLRCAINIFLEWAKDPPKWKGHQRKRTPKKTAPSQQTSAPEERGFSKEELETNSSVPNLAPHQSLPDLVLGENLEYRFPFCNGQYARLSLPSSALKKTELGRLARFLEALALDTSTPPIE